MKPTIINESSDYSKFQLFLFNRAINDGLVKRIMQSIQDIGWISAKPILVDKTLAIIDGQHRFEACRRLGLPIYYVITDVDPQVAIINLNANQVDWKLIDYINSWAESGVRCYQTVREFDGKHKLGMNSSVTICFGLNDSAQIKRIKEGHKFPINPIAEDIAEFINGCSSVPYYKSSYFIRAVVKLFKLANKTQLEKVKNNIMSLPQQATTADYMMAFENIVNRNMRKVNHISFKASQ